MNYETQAKNGFKTFIITLCISLVAFSAIYYLVSDATGNVDIESIDKQNEQSANFEVKEQVAGTTSQANNETKQETVFSEIAQKPTNAKSTLANANTVLGAATETTQSTVPNTGSETLVGAALAGMFFSVAIYLLFIGPRKLALESFEAGILKKS